MRDQVNGRVRSVVVAATLAIAFATGCVTAEDKAKDSINANSVAETTEEMKTFAEWVDVYNAEHEAALKAHPDLDYIERGAALHCMLSKHVWGVYDPTIKHDLGRLTKISKSYYDAFVAFMASAKGKAMFAKYKKDGSLNQENQAYYWVVQATVDEYKKFRSTDEGKIQYKNASSVITKLYKGHLLTRFEMDKFREYNAV